MGQSKAVLVATLLDCLRSGALQRVAYYELLDQPRSNLRDCFHPMDGKQPVRERARRPRAGRGAACAVRAVARQSGVAVVVAVLGAVAAVWG